MQEKWPNKTKFVCRMIVLVIFLGLSKVFWKYIANTNPQRADIEDLSADLMNPLSCLLLIHFCIRVQSVSVEEKWRTPQGNSEHLRRRLRVKSHFSEDWLLVPRLLYSNLVLCFDCRYLIRPHLGVLIAQKGCRSIEKPFQTHESLFLFRFKHSYAFSNFINVSFYFWWFCGISGALSENQLYSLFFTMLMVPQILGV